MIRRIGYLMLFFLFGMTVGPPVLAQSRDLHINPEPSTARLFLASSQKPDASVNVGVARIKGVIHWNTNDPGSSTLDFDISPADGKAYRLEPGSGAVNQSLPNTNNYVILSFKSKRIVQTGGDVYRVFGELKVLHATRSTTYDPTKTYEGPIYGPVVVHTAVRDVAFVFQTSKSTDRAAGKTASATWIASSVISSEDFPELLKAVSTTVWPVFVENQECVFPSSVGEDFSGPKCTEKTVDPLPRIDIRCQVAGCTGVPLQLVTNNASGNRMQKDSQQSNRKGALIADEVKFHIELQFTKVDSTRSDVLAN